MSHNVKVKFRKGRINFKVGDRIVVHPGIPSLQSIGKIVGRDGSAYIVQAVSGPLREEWGSEKELTFYTHEIGK